MCFERGGRTFQRSTSISRLFQRRRFLSAPWRGRSAWSVCCQQKRGVYAHLVLGSCSGMTGKHVQRGCKGMDILSIVGQNDSMNHLSIILDLRDHRIIELENRRIRQLLRRRRGNIDKPILTTGATLSRRPQRRLRNTPSAENLPGGFGGIPQRTRQTSGKG